jgi:N-acetylmuramoyl-L-alanine amidase
MTAFISRHNPKGIKVDPGAVANGLTEANLAVEFRNLVVTELLKRKVKVITDRDDERLVLI